MGDGHEVMLTALSYYFICDIEEKSIMHMHWAMRYGDPIYMSPVAA